MDTTQSEALRLADALELDPMPIGWYIEAAAELRRLHAVNAELLRVLDDLAAWPDGPVGGHMDEPHAAFVARCALAYARSKEKDPGA